MWSDSWREKSCRRRSKTPRSLLMLSTVVIMLPSLLLVLLLLGETPAVEGLEMEAVRGGCLQVTLKPGEHVKTDPRFIVSRGTGLALRPPALPSSSGIVSGLKRRIRRSHGRREEPRDHPLQRLSNTMASNETDCLLAPMFPGDVTLMSVSIAGSGSGNHNEDQQAASDVRRKATTDGRGGRSSSPSTARRREEAKVGGGRKQPSSTESDSSERPRNLVVLTQAIVAVGPKVTVRPLSSADPGGRARGALSSRQTQHQRGSGIAAIGALSVCEGQGPVAVAGYGKLRKIRLSPGQRRVVDSSRAVGWTSGVMCLAGTAGRASGGGKSGNEVPSLSTVTTFVGPGTVYVQTHSLTALRRLLLPRQSMGVSLPGGVASGFFGVGGASAGSSSSRTGRPGAVVGLSLKRGLAKRAKASAKRVALGLAFFALYLVVYSLATALLLEGRDGLVKAPRHAVQVVRSLVKVARRIALVLVRLFREEVWRSGEEGTAGPVEFLEETPLVSR
ncbi:unnamed protein product [Scytosiphon promiscuus]